MMTAGISANLTMVNAIGGIATVSGLLDVIVNGTEKSSGVDATLSIAKLRAVTMTIDSKNTTGLFGGQSLYGIAEEPRDETVIASDMTAQKNGSGLLGNITSKFKLPKLPNPFH